MSYRIVVGQKEEWADAYLPADASAETIHAIADQWSKSSIAFPLRVFATAEGLSTAERLLELFDEEYPYAVGVEIEYLKDQEGVA